MPELPEVETVRIGMEASICGKAVYSVDVRCRKLRKKVPKNFEQKMSGKFINSLKRRGKYIIFEFKDEPDEVAVLHLGMSGCVQIYCPEEAEVYEPRKHDHIILNMEDGTRVVYEDPRRFGMFYFLKGCRKDGWGALPPFNTMGPEPLGASWDGAVLYEKICDRNAPVKTLLLDQKIVAGLGNIYVCEALYVAGVDVKKRGKDLALAKCNDLVEATKDVLVKALEAGGSSLRDYQKTDGSLGYFQHSFQVYNREGRACFRDGCGGIIKRVSLAGRSTFYCPSCQK